MATVFTHAFAAASLGAALTPGRVDGRLLLTGAVCAVLPDLDVVGIPFGVSYGELLGHRGLSHSLVFAALLAAIATAVYRRSGPRAPALGPLALVLYLFAATASHGLLDAATNGGLGVAFFAPFDDHRWFLPFRPVEVSPIGVLAFLQPRALVVLGSELLWIWVPWTLLALGISGVVRWSAR